MQRGTGFEALAAVHELVIEHSLHLTPAIVSRRPLESLVSTYTVRLACDGSPTLMDFAFMYDNASTRSDSPSCTYEVGSAACKVYSGFSDASSLSITPCFWWLHRIFEGNFLSGDPVIKIPCFESQPNIIVDHTAI